MKSPDDKCPPNQTYEAKLHEKLTSRPLITPRSEIRRHIIASAYATELPSPWILGAIILMVFIVLYSLLLKPGITLDWSAGSQFDAFHISRSISGDDRYIHLITINAVDGKQKYSYWDPLTFSGNTYLYKIDATNDDGITSERVVTIHSRYDILLSQLGIALFSLISSYSLTSIIVDHIKKQKFEKAYIQLVN